MKIYRFRNFYLNPTERRVIKNGQFLELTTKTFDILQLLIENGTEIVTKDEILGKVWNGSFVEEGNLPVHISKLRRLLDEDKNQLFIETIQGSGYRFVAPVYEVSQAEWEKNLSEIDPAPRAASREWAFDSIAVLPLQNENGDEDIEYLADGLTESFINSLSRLPNLKVIARNTVFRYKNKPTDAREVGETLGVATILTGRIRIIKDRLIIGIELTKTTDGTQLWGTHFNRLFTDIFEIQDSIISEILENLKSEINYNLKNQIKPPITEHPESYRLYLKGKHLLSKRNEDSLNKAIECFQKSIFFDPFNVYSYVEIVETYGQLYVSGFINYSNFLEKIKPFLPPIAELRESVDVVQIMYGRIACFAFKFHESETFLLNALSLNPNSLTANHRYAGLLIARQKFSEALKVLNRLLQLAPLSVESYIHVARGFYRMQHFETAKIYLIDALDLDPNNYEVLAILGAVLVEMGNFDEALSIFQKSLEVSYSIEIISMIGYLNAIQNNRSETYEIIERIKTEFSDDNEFSSNLARIYFALGELDIGYKLLSDAFEKHEADIFAIAADPRLSRIRNEPRFKELIDKVGFPIYTR